MVVGPWQSGKTTLVRQAFPEKAYASLEDPDQRLLAEADPRAFLAQFPDGAILDEVQRAAPRAQLPAGGPGRLGAGWALHPHRQQQHPVAGGREPDPGGPRGHPGPAAAELPGTACGRHCPRPGRAPPPRLLSGGARPGSPAGRQVLLPCAHLRGARCAAGEEHRRHAAAHALPKAVRGPLRPAAQRGRAQQRLRHRCADRERLAFGTGAHLRHQAAAALPPQLQQAHRQAAQALLRGHGPGLFRCWASVARRNCGHRISGAH